MASGSPEYAIHVFDFVIDCYLKNKLTTKCVW